MVDQWLSLDVKEMEVSFEASGDDVVNEHDDRDRWAYKRVKGDVAE